MKIVPKVNFEGYPDDVKTKFRVGVEADVPPDYAKMLEGKGLIEKSKPKSSMPFAEGVAFSPRGKSRR